MNQMVNGDKLTQINVWWNKNKEIQVERTSRKTKAQIREKSIANINKLDVNGQQISIGSGKSRLVGDAEQSRLQK